MIMGSSSRPIAVLVLLLLCTPRVLPGRCTKSDANGNYVKIEDCNDFCGIDPKTGFAQGCVPSAQCPSGVSGDDNVYCENGKPSCCCEPTIEFGEGEEVPTCNNLLHSDHRRKIACRNQDLSSLEICLINPQTPTFCATQSAINKDNEKCGILAKFCGIDPTTGYPQGCISGSQCPSNAQYFGEEVSCERGLANCCCKSKGEYGPVDKIWACNNIFNWENSGAWERTCEDPGFLRNLNVCRTFPVGPPLTVENMKPECVEHCKTEQAYEDKGTKPFEVDCKEKGSYSSSSSGPKTQGCKSPCPKTCHCSERGRTLKCPGGLPIKRLPIEYDTETYVVIFFLLPVFGLAVTAAIIYAVFMSMKKKKIEVVVDPMALNRFYSTYPRPGFGFWQPPPQEETSEQVAADGSQQQVGQPEQQQEADKKIQ